MTSARCENCEAELQGEYCHACGQKSLPPEAWSIRHATRDFWQELSELDSKVVLTLKCLLFKPGELTRQYLSGHRQPFVPPVKLYLGVTALFFFLGAQAEFSIEGFQKAGNAGGLTDLVRKVAEVHKIPYEVELEKFNEGFHKKFSIVMAFAVLALGWFVHLLYRKSEVYYARSIVFALHFLSLFFVLLLAWRLTLHYAVRVPMQAFFLLVLPFLAMSLWRVWPERASRFIPKLLLLWVLTAMLYTLSIGTGIGAQIASYGRVVQQVMSKER